MSTPTGRPGTSANHRRSQRILLAIPVHVAGKRKNGSAFVEGAKTAVVSAHGALLLMHELVAAGTDLKVTNIATKEEAICKVIEVVNGQGGFLEVGIEFIEALPRFWRVSFPPEDWSPHGPESKRFGVAKLASIPTPVKK